MVIGNEEDDIGLIMLLLRKQHTGKCECCYRQKSILDEVTHVVHLLILPQKTGPRLPAFLMSRHPPHPLGVTPAVRSRVAR
jgi:hypothetical protein